MKLLKVKFGIYEPLLLLTIIAIALFVRLYNFTDRITFGPEQAISLITSGEYIKVKPSLVGQGNLIRINSKGLRLFSSPLFNYSLVPLELIFNFNPIPITGYFALLNVFTGIVLYLVVKRMLGRNIAILSMIIFLFNDYMIYHSLFIWILNYLPLISVLTIYLLYKFNLKKKYVFSLLLGVLSGIGFGLEYFYILTLFVVLTIIIFLSNNKIRDILYFALGVIIGNFPYILFDFRHDYYHTKTLFQYLIDMLTFHSQANITYYHFLNIWPPVIILLAYVINKITQKRKLLVLVSLLIFVFTNLVSKIVDFSKPIGMPVGLTYKKVLKAAQIISDNNPNNFNLAVLLDFDTRGHILRYPVEYIFGKKPLGIEEYKDAGEIYVLARNDFDFENSHVWELAIFAPYKVEILSELDYKYGVYKLTKR